jgi:WD repeat-containing protein 35
MPQGAGVRCVAWSGGEQDFLACGCDSGMLKVLKIEGEGGEKGLLAAPSNIAMNQTLEGHSSNIQVIAWNNVHHKLTTSDAKGKSSKMLKCLLN